MRSLRFLPLFIMLLLVMVLPASAAGTFTRISDINPGSADSFPGPAEGAIFNGQLYFAASSTANNHELWRYDGLTTSLVMDIWIGTFGSYPRDFLVFNGALYFFADDVTHGTELWRHDGTNLTRVTSNIPNGRPTVAGLEHTYKPTIFNGMLYFLAGNINTGPIELWKFNGSSATSVRVVDPDGFMLPSAALTPPDMAVYQNALYFSASNASGTVVDLCRLDAAEAFSCITNNAVDGGYAATEVEVANDLLYFAGRSGSLTFTLWKYDGSTITVAADRDALYLRAYDDELYFGASDPTYGVELWKHDGSTATRLTDINPGSANASTRPEFVHNGYLYFRAQDATHGHEYWTYDGVTAQRVTDFATHPSPDPFNPDYFYWIPSMVAVNGSKIYMVGYDGTYGNELWVYTDEVTPTITSANPATFYEGVANTFTVTAIGTPSTMIYALTGTLPAGVIFNTSTGVLSGTPAAGTAGSYSVTITASNGVAPDASQNFTLNVVKVAYPAEPVGNASCAKLAANVNVKIRGMIAGREYTTTLEVRDATTVYMLRQSTSTFAGPTGTQVNLKWVIFPYNNVPALAAPQTYNAVWTTLSASVTLRLTVVDRTTNLQSQTTMTYTCGTGVVSGVSTQITPNVTTAPYAP